MSEELNYSKADIMVVTMARLLKDAENAFMGVASNLPFFAIWLAKELYNPNLVWLNIPGRVNPSPSYAPKSTVHAQLSHKGTASVTLAEIFDMSARGELDVAFLSGIQIDFQGYFNLSHISDGTRIMVQFPGGAGSALICANSRRVILWRTRHDKRTFNEKCQVVTASGNVYKVVTSDVVFKKDGPTLQLESIHPHTTFEEVVENTGFPISPAPFTPEPTNEELGLLREFDPENVREIEFLG
ncbi:MAG: CoA-transferase [Candidatus Dadabacteria bacterium]|nr:CoA-transferase [Candidatus Dadabacteria bacterium]